MFSEIESVSDLYNELYLALYPDEILAVASGATVSDVDAENVYGVYFNGTGKIYYTAGADEDEDTYGDETGELYELTMNGGRPSAGVLVDTGVFVDTRIRFTEDGLPVYFKNFNDAAEREVGDLFVNKQIVGYDVYAYEVSTIGNSVLFYTDWNSDRNCGTLNVFTNGETNVVSDDVGNAVMTDSGDILFLYDYSISRRNGTLCLYSGGNVTKLDDDVELIIPISAGGRGWYN